MRLFISDLHLENPDSIQFQTFEALLACESRRCDEIYLLGDLLEVWIGDDDDGELAQAFTRLLARSSGSCDVFLMHGNRDFLLGERFARAAGVTLLSDPHQLPDGTLLSHGDMFCTDDSEYQQLRAVLRSADWQRDVLSRSLDERRALAQNMREVSRAANANKAANIMDVNPAAVRRFMAEHNSEHLIHGHTHRPGMHRESWGSRAVLGAWEHCGWLLRTQRQDVRLECFPLAGRYETGTGYPAH